MKPVPLTASTVVALLGLYVGAYCVDTGRCEDPPAQAVLMEAKWNSNMIVRLHDSSLFRVFTPLAFAEATIRRRVVIVFPDDPGAIGGEEYYFAPPMRLGPLR